MYAMQTLKKKKNRTIILSSDEVGFRLGKLIKDNERHHIMINGSMVQEQS
jgi:hypothetical protein